jgi:hypothetical protein
MLEKIYIAVFWVVTLYNLRVEDGSNIFPTTLVSTCQTTQCRNPENKNTSFIRRIK